MSPFDKLHGKVQIPNQPPSPTKPVWEGPFRLGPNGGITQGLLGRYLCCKERFRLLMVEGLKPIDTFSHRLEFGNLWHTCEENLARGNDPTRGGRTGRSKPLWEEALLQHARILARQYPMQTEQVDHWFNVVRVTFPLYVTYWERHPDVTQRTPLFQEQVFDVDYLLPSGRPVRLRGKWDSVDLVGSGTSATIYLKENKTKGDINEGQIKRQLSYDMQTMLYLVALQEHLIDNPAGGSKVHPWSKIPVDGVVYNVIRRPLSGGKGTIVRHKPSKGNPQGESKDAYYRRLAGIIAEDPASYFMRWKVEVSSADVQRFRCECLNPVLENLCDDWEWWQFCATHKEGLTAQDVSPFPGVFLNDRHQLFPHHWPRHFRLPFGCYNPLLEGNVSDLDEYLHSGSTAGLQRTTNLFPELT